jgi:DNA-binding NarL/FixJ family response regulator
VDEAELAQPMTTHEPSQWDRIRPDRVRCLRVLIADDHRLMLDTVRLVLDEDPEIEIVGEALSGSQVLPLVRQTSPDVVLLDMRMPGMDGLTCLTSIREGFPDVKVIVLSGHDEPALVRAALQRGASYFISKQILPRDLPGAVRQAYEGTIFAELRDAESAATPNESGLTPRELAILEAVGAGRSNKQIARDLWLAEPTIKYHLTNIYRKLGVASRTEAVHQAFSRGLIENPLIRSDSAAR